MKKIISIVVFLFFGIILSAQTSNAGVKDSCNVSSPDTSKHFRFVFMDGMPKFPGDSGSFQKYLIDNLKYPAKEKSEGKEGTVYVGFTVEKDGTVTDQYIVKSSGDDAFDKEAMRVISTMPNWLPGKIDGKLVRVSMTQPVKFVLDKKK
jgi:protein TonB